MTSMPCTCGGNGVCTACCLSELGWAPLGFDAAVPVPAPEPDLDLDELRVKHAETRDAALELAARVAERVLDGPFDPSETLYTGALAASLIDLLKNERRLRRAIKAEVAG